MKVPLVEGVDYYSEEGRVVFTAEYHLRRGYCCNSGCRHCPYGSRSLAGVDVAAAVPDHQARPPKLRR